MAIKVVNIGERLMLADIKANTLDGISVGLFINNYTPADGDTLANYTAATFGSYAAASPTWGSITTNATTGKAQMLSSAMVWSPSSGPVQTVYGWYMFKGTELIEAERFDTPYEVGAGGGDDIPLQIRQTLSTEA